MKKLFISISFAIALISCVDGTNDSKEFEKTAEAGEGVNEASSDITANPNAFEENLDEFKSCRSTKKTNAECKEFIAKAVCEYYGIDDLKEGTNYVDYDKIPEKLKELDSWEKVGDFTEENIQTALEQLNNFGKPVLVFNEDDKYVHVVALAPNGKVLKSRKWGNISVPSCISYFPRRNDSFTKNGINYAFKKADNLVIWMKN